MVSAKQPLSPFQARSNYKLVGQSFSSFVSALETLAQSTGKLHSLSVWRPGTKSLSTPACRPFFLGHQLAKPAQQIGIPLQETLTLRMSRTPSCVLKWWLRSCSLGLLELLWFLWVRFERVRPWGSCVCDSSYYSSVLLTGCCLSSTFNSM